MLGSRVKEIRELKGFGLNELARMANISAGYLSSIENSKRDNPSMDILKAIAGALNASVEDLFKEAPFKYTDKDKILEDNKKLLSKISNLTESKKQLIKNLINEFEVK